jgi:DNA-directed RNA polymerase sigma subunit (sigma70/sigma32)
MYRNRAIQNIQDETEFNRIYEYEDLLKVARTSNHPSIIAYLRLIELRDNAIKKTGKNLLKSEWAKLAQSSIRGLEISIKLGLIEWAELAHISLENLDWTEKRAIQARKNLRDFYQYLITDLVDKHQNRGLDILQVDWQGKIGLDYAIDNYNRNKKVQFLKFANYWIEYKIIKAIELTTSARLTDRALTNAKKNHRFDCQN